MNHQEIATFLVVSLNGAAPLYAASKDPGVWRDTLVQLRYYLKSLRKEG
jgi:TetR/AcrR family transcriptional repressor of nem operon